MIFLHNIITELKFYYFYEFFFIQLWGSKPDWYEKNEFI